MVQFSIYLFCLLVGVMQTTIAWKAVLDRYEISYINDKYVTLNYAQIYKYNRTTKAGSIEFDLKVDLPLDAMIEIKIYGLFSNQYRVLPLVITRKICDILNLEYQWIKPEINGHFLNNCPITKGKYNIKDYVPNVSRFPKKPWNINNYMIAGRIYVKKENLVLGKVFVITTDDDEYAVKK